MIRERAEGAAKRPQKCASIYGAQSRWVDSIESMAW